MTKEEAERLEPLVEDMEGEYGFPPWEALKKELRAMGVKLRLCDDYLETP